MNWIYDSLYIITSKHTPTHYTDIVVTSVDGSQIKFELFSDSALKNTVEAAFNIAKHASHDKHAGLVEKTLMAKNIADLEGKIEDLKHISSNSDLNIAEEIGTYQNVKISYQT